MVPQKLARVKNCHYDVFLPAVMTAALHRCGFPKQFMPPTGLSDLHSGHLEKNVLGSVRLSYYSRPKGS